MRPRINVYPNFQALIANKISRNEYTEEQGKYILEAALMIPSNKANNIEFYLNIIDLYDTLLEEEALNLGVEDLVAKNRTKLEAYIVGGNLFSTPLIDNVREENEKEIKLLKESEVGTKGVATCSRCHLDNLIITSAQTRSGDEGETIFYRCLDCDNRWREN